MPDFLVIGAAKAGTTSLYYYLKEHPAVFVPTIKEPNFFGLEGIDVAFADPSSPQSVNRWSVTQLEDYQRLFERANGRNVAGECSPFYLYSERAPRLILHHVPDIKLIVILRNPIDRAFSSYMYFRNSGLEPIDNFRQALDLEESRIANGWWFVWHYKKASLYYAQLSRYFELFRREQILTLYYDDLAACPQVAVRGIFEFIGVDAHFQPRLGVVYGATGHPTSDLADRLLFKDNMVRRAARRVLPAPLKARIAASIKKRFLTKADLDRATRDYLAKYFAADVERLSGLLGRDLGAWLETRA